MIWQASAPSNIALIKYMGKTADGSNTGVNPSLSLTLPHLLSHVEMTENTLGHDQWSSLDGQLKLSETGRAKFLNHLQFLKKVYLVEDRFFTVRSKNDFPSDCGIASSASSFAALTKCADKAFSSISGKKMTLEQLAALSRHGSGSSCRSFFEGFVEWDGEDGIRPLVLPKVSTYHQVYILSSQIKSVSSSQAHQRVGTSLLMKGRTARAVERLEKTKALLTGDMQWNTLFEICWSEFWDMHALFETASPAFGYMTPQSLKLINEVRDLWTSEGDGPLVTMDAGPNVHLIWRSEQMVRAQAFVKTQDCRVFSTKESQ
jgi:diphosphomevalonate decarboxylase